MLVIQRLSCVQCSAASSVVTVAAKVAATSVASARWRAAIAMNVVGSRGTSIVPPPRARISATRSLISSVRAGPRVGQQLCARSRRARREDRERTDRTELVGRARDEAGHGCHDLGDRSAERRDRVVGVDQRCSGAFGAIDGPAIERRRAPRMRRDGLDRSTGLGELDDRAQATIECPAVERRRIGLGERSARRGA